MGRCGAAAACVAALLEAIIRDAGRVGIRIGRPAPVGAEVVEHGDTGIRVIVPCPDDRLVGMPDLLRLPRLCANNGEVAGGRGPRHLLVDIVHQREVLGIAPEQWDCVAVFIGHGQFAVLFGQQRRRHRRRVLLLLHGGEFVHLWRAVHDIHLSVDASVRVVDIVGVGRELRWADTEGLNRRGRAVGVGDRLVVAGCLARRL